MYAIYLCSCSNGYIMRLVWLYFSCYYRSVCTLCSKSDGSGSHLYMIYILNCHKLSSNYMLGLGRFECPYLLMCAELLCAIIAHSNLQRVQSVMHITLHFELSAGVFKCGTVYIPIQIDIECGNTII